MAAADLAKLESLTDNAERNALALKLGEARTPGLAEVLVRLIRRPDLRDHRGTLVHVLGFHDCSAYLPLLAELVVDGNWEVAHEAFEIVDTVDAADEDDVEQALALVKTARPSEDWRRELLEDLAELLE